jgi:transcriptional regulator with XRE-family HTH domain
MPQSDPVFIGRRVREERLRKGMAQVELGRRLGLKAPTSMMKYEKGESAFSAEMLIEAGNVLGVTVDVFTREADDSPRVELVVDNDAAESNAMALEAVLLAVDHFEQLGASLTADERTELREVASGLARKGGLDALVARLVRLVLGWRLERTASTSEQQAEQQAREQHDVLLKKDGAVGIVQLKVPGRGRLKK